VRVALGHPVSLIREEKGRVLVAVPSSKPRKGTVDQLLVQRSRSRFRLAFWPKRSSTTGLFRGSTRRSRRTYARNSKRVGRRALHEALNARFDDRCRVFKTPSLQSYPQPNVRKPLRQRRWLIARNERRETPAELVRPIANRRRFTINENAIESPTFWSDTEAAGQDGVGAWRRQTWWLRASTS
jgi:hypothetical protein